MWIRFTARAQRILPTREAFYYAADEVLDLPRPWAEEHLAAGEAERAPNPAAHAPADPWLPPSLGTAPITVACVQKRGGPYDGLDYAARLARGVARNLTLPHRFVCLTDEPKLKLPKGAEIVPLQHGWPGFWSKVELFRSGLFTGPVLYLDLDTVVCGPLDDIAAADDPLLVSWDPNAGWLNSSVIRWSVDLSCVHQAMLDDPQGVMRRYDGSAEHLGPDGLPKWGDQGLLQDVLLDRRIPWRWMQDAFPHRLDVPAAGVRADAAPEGVSLSLWMGHPKPHQAGGPLLAEHWI